MRIAVDQWNITNDSQTGCFGYAIVPSGFKASGKLIKHICLVNSGLTGRSVLGDIWLKVAKTTTIDVDAGYFNKEYVKLYRELTTSIRYTEEEKAPMLKELRSMYFKPMVPSSEIVQHAARLDEFYMQVAYSASFISYAKRRKVGAVAVREGKIIGFGFNKMPEELGLVCEDEFGETLPEVVHAEVNMLENASEFLNTVLDRSTKITVYITKEPCKNCAKILVETIGENLEVVFCEESVRAPGEGLRILRLNDVPYRMVERP